MKNPEEDSSEPILPSTSRSDTVHKEIQGRDAIASTLKSVELTHRPLLDNDGEICDDEAEIEIQVTSSSEDVPGKSSAGNGKDWISAGSDSFKEVLRESSHVQLGDGAKSLLDGTERSSFIYPFSKGKDGIFGFFEAFSFDAPSVSRIAFLVINCEVLAALIVIAVLGVSSTCVILGFLLWLLLLAVNLFLATRPKLVIREYLRTKWKTRLDGGGLTKGRRKVAVITGRVSRLEEDMYSTEEDIVPGCIIMHTVLQSLHAREPWRIFLPSDHLHQTIATDFMVTDDSGNSVIVKARHAAEAGQVVGMVHGTTAIPLPSSRKVIGFLNPDWLMKEQQYLADNPNLVRTDLVITRGYITEGQTITVMGALHTSEEGSKLVLEPLEAPHNVSKMLLFWRFIPFFYPTIAHGLIVSDQLGFWKH